MAKDTQTIAGTAPDTLVMENSLDLPSFTIEFLEHLSPTDWQHWLDQIRNTGAVGEHRNGRVFAVVCIRRSNSLLSVGFCFRAICETYVASLPTAGGAEAQASAYPKPQKK